MVRMSVCWFLGSLFSLVAHAEVVEIDPAQVARLSASGVPIIDVRTEGEWKETGVIPGSRLLTFVDERGRSDPPAWLASVQEATKRKQPVILVCRSGKRSRAAGEFLSQQAGYSTVYDLKGGILAWDKEGLPLAPAVTAPTCPTGARC
ncbi:MAG: rhodanese-like domain-containing protein [Candidatus Accumulibacter sp.]|uniref:rhodanese-like domain-containing protein n=1 Tax=Accumulibacter sp. TaxID=2053492 RepID=UPI0025DDE872|nr:rhodanese-like domain-containing protein [Accumulibacter sp.]MCM8597540.1 rhodanese-like domain-containing protein [Accumulibacter sp.]